MRLLLKSQADTRVSCVFESDQIPTGKSAHAQGCYEPNTCLQDRSRADWYGRGHEETSSIAQAAVLWSATATFSTTILSQELVATPLTCRLVCSSAWKISSAFRVCLEELDKEAKVIIRTLTDSLLSFVLV